MCLRCATVAFVKAVLIGRVSPSHPYPRVFVQSIQLEKARTPARPGDMLAVTLQTRIRVLRDQTGRKIDRPERERPGLICLLPWAGSHALLFFMTVDSAAGCGCELHVRQNTQTTDVTFFFSCLCRPPPVRTGFLDVSCRQLNRLVS
ncbi:hypothetical protein B0T22DRAFT_266344 [Podospora appendiculata]|uniref:Secreted protein n=1 Tax=Podospora appendiculata TaxID=314037 RepID=A0AAE1C9A8_9PEZI|nr:hypothetical protein B0T22DRAFT_266344 [Podospora appendiculata]